jgi:sortase A
VLVLIDAGVTLVWQEPFSGIYASLQQEHLRSSLNAIDRAAPPPAVRSKLSRIHKENERIALLASAFEHKAKNGSAVGRIEIPHIGADFVMVKGTDTADLEKGPGIYSDTNFPGIAGTTAIAGHRTTYLAPFRRINELHKGDKIILRMPYARFVYEVTGQRSVLPSDVRAAVDYVGYTRLVLSACTPPFSAAERLLVFARIARIMPLGAARPT